MIAKISYHESMLRTDDERWHCTVTLRDAGDPDPGHMVAAGAGATKQEALERAAQYHRGAREAIEAALVDAMVRVELSESAITEELTPVRRHPEHRG